MFEKLRTKGTLSDRAYEVLKEKILYLELEPGTALMEEDLSEKLGISRTPIREALRRLSYEGLVTFTDSRRMHVTELSMDYFLDVAALREALELLAVRLASLNRTDADLDILKEIVNEQRGMLKDSNLDSNLDSFRFLDSDRKYHAAIVKSSRNELLAKYISENNEAFHRYLYYTKFNHRATNVVSEHERIFEAISYRDSFRAEMIMKEHLAGVKESIILAISKM